MTLTIISRLRSRSLSVCPTCASNLYHRSARYPRRSISQDCLRKTGGARADWDRQASDIKAGKRESMLSMLEQRGYINQIVGDRNDLEQLMTEKRIGIYCGIDPTAPSLHIGHLLPLMVLYWMYIHGFHACSLLGGATAQIGDPIGRSSSREKQNDSTYEISMTKMHLQLKSIWENVELLGAAYGYHRQSAWRRELINNNEWLNKLPAVELMKVLGRGVRLGMMLGRDTVKNRTQQGEGMSFAEFTYPLLQSWDWWHMYQTKDIQVQVGGSDQFGNILAGVEAINHIRHNHYNPEIRQAQNGPNEHDALQRKPFGFTVPLLTTSSGQKFGKSAGNAIWLDGEMTSPFDLFQFFMRVADADVLRYLKLFTFEPLDKLEQLMQEHNQEPSKRVAQRKLAREVLQIVHGSAVAQETEQEHTSVFRKPSASNDLLPTPYQSPEDAEDMKRSSHPKAPVTKANPVRFHSLTLPACLVYNQPISRILYHAGLAASRSEGHRLVANKGAYIGSQPDSTSTMSDQVDFSPVFNWDASETEKYIIGGDTLILRVGKWKVKVVKIVSDEEFDEQGLAAPGWNELKAERPG